MLHTLDVDLYDSDCSTYDSDSITSLDDTMAKRRRRVNVLYFPTEICDAIAAQLDSPVGLRSFALTCTQLRDVVFTRHMLTWKFGPLERCLGC